MKLYRFTCVKEHFPSRTVYVVADSKGKAAERLKGHISVGYSISKVCYCGEALDFGGRIFVK